MDWNDTLTELRELLAVYYPTDDDTRRLVAEAHVPAKQVKFAGKATDTWQSLLEEARKSDRIDEIIAIAAREYATNSSLVGQLDRIARQLRAQEGPGGAVPDGRFTGPVYEEQRRAYLDALRERYNWVNTGAFVEQGGPRQTGKSSRLPLLGDAGQEGVYVPLAFDPMTGPDRAADRSGKRKAQDEAPELAMRTRLPLAQVLKEPGHLAIVGAAGCGKTTVLHMLAALLTDPDPASFTPDLAAVLPTPLPLPIFLPLRLFEHACASNSSQRTLVSLLRFLDDWFRQGYAGETPLPEDFLAGHVRAGSAWLLLDALDEVPDPIHRKTIRNLIQNDLTAHCGRTRLIVTARVAGYRDAPLDSRFRVVRVADLDEEQRAMMVRRLYRGLQLPDQERQATILLETMARRPDLAFLTTTPVMVWTAAVIHAFRGTLPEGRAALYDAYVDILLRKSFDVPWHDQAALKPLVETEEWSLADRRLALSYGAFATHRWQEERPERRDEAEQSPGAISLHELADDFLAGYFPTQYWTQPGHEAHKRARDFVSMMVERSGLLVEDADGFHFGDHLTMQEFLAACYLGGNYGYDDRRGYETLIQEKVGVAWWREVFLLAVGYLAARGGREGADLLRLLARQGQAPAERLAALELAGSACAQLQVLQAPPGWFTQLRGELAGQLEQAVLSDKRLDASVQARHLAGLALGRLWGWEGDPRFQGPFGLPEFVTIPAGSFIMGRDDSDRENERPTHLVHLDSYQIAQFPTTNAMFKRFLDDQGYDTPDFWTEAIADGRWQEGKVRDYSGEWRAQPVFWNDEKWNNPAQPVVGVTWYEAAAYCRWLSQVTGQRTWLPSEAQWEKAAAYDPHQNAVRRYPWGDDWQGGRANSNEAGLGQTSLVGLFPAGRSALGVEDLTGNVWEWCQDWYAPYARSEARNPAGPQQGDSRVLRGGSAWNDKTRCRCGYRYRLFPVFRDNDLGFRCARASS